ncbi:MAG TPA: aspartate aminotransferase family protein [Acidobacteriota bacterium]|nr:aspartate aminotransferase family protein [Acidobacteriota bacterium]
MTIADKQSRSTVGYLNGESRSKELYERALEVMPGGNSRHTLVMDPYPIYATSGKGCRVTDVEGDERIDFINNYTALIRGHADAVVTEAVRAVVGRGTAFSMPTESDIRLAELLVDRVPGMEQIRFANSGSEGVLLTIRAARAATGRSKIAKFEGCYHGVYDYAQASDSSRPHNWGDRRNPRTTLEPSMARSLFDEVVTLPWNDIEACRTLIGNQASNLAAVVFDPLPAALGLIAPDQGFVEFLREITRQHGILLIADEVLSFRVSYQGACAAHGIEPDLVSLGKIIGGGFPVGAVMGKRSVMDVFDHRAGEKVHHGGTYNGNPVTMVAGYETMRQMTREAYDRLESLGDRLRAGVAETVGRHGIAHQVTGRGSLFGVLFTEAPIRDFRGLLEASAVEPGQAKVVAEMLSRGILLGQRGVLGCLSTPMGTDEIDAFVVALDESLGAARQR